MKKKTKQYIAMGIAFLMAILMLATLIVPYIGL